MVSDADLSRGKTNYIMKQLLAVEVLNVMLVSATEHQRGLGYRLCHLVFSGGYHIISGPSTVNSYTITNGLILLASLCHELSSRGPINNIT